MNILRKLLLGLVSFLFIVLLFTTAFAVGFIRFSSSPEKLKVTTAKSGIYSSVVPAILDQAGSISTYRAGDIPLNDPGVKLAAQKAVPASYVQKSTESFVDSIYRWLNGKTREPDFYLDLGPPKTALAANISEYIQAKLDSLPACAPNVLPNPATLNVFSMTCKPVALNSADVANSLKAEIVKNSDVVDRQLLTANQISAGDGSGKSIFQVQLVNAPKAYQKAKMSPVVLSVLTLLSALAIVFLSATWPVGLRRAGIGLLIVGVIMMISAFALNHESSTQIAPRIKMDNVALQGSIRNLATDIIQQIDKNYWFFGGLYTALGVGMIVGGETFRRRAQPEHQLGTTEPGQEAPKDKTKPAEEPKKAKPKKVKIQ